MYNILLAFIKGSKKKQPTKNQIKLLNEMMFHAFVEIRILGWAGKAEQVAALADAFHNLPVQMLSDTFNWDYFRNSFLGYQQDYPDREYGGFNYLAFLDNIQKTV